MLTVGIVLLAGSVGAVVIFLALVAIFSPQAHFASTEVRMAMYLLEPENVRPARTFELTRGLSALALVAGAGFCLGMLVVALSVAVDLA